MEKQQLASNQKRKIEELHWEIQQWKSSFMLIDDEILFIRRLLDSYIFQPNTPNLFERLQDYKTGLKKLQLTKAAVREHISKHENDLGGMLECKNCACDLSYYRKHDKLQIRVDDCVVKFQKLKSEIFNYAGSILKKRKP